MQMMTSAIANKKLKKLNEEKNFWIQKEKECSTYAAEIDEEPVVPEYDFTQVSKKIAQIDAQVIKIKHALNVSNAANTITIDGEELTIDQVLIKMAQLSQRRNFYDGLRMNEPKKRISGTGYFSRTKNLRPEYQYINYDLDLVRAEFERVDAQLLSLQMALDVYNQTAEFPVDI